MKIYKYEMQCYNSVKKITEYLVEFNYNEIYEYGSERIIRFVFNTEDELWEMEEDDDCFLNVIDQDLIKYELVEISPEIIRNLWENYKHIQMLKGDIKKTNKSTNYIISGIKNAK